MIDDTALRGRWFLGSPVDAAGGEIDPRDFTDGVARDVTGPIRLPIRRKGTELDFTFADFDMPVVRTAIALALETAAPRACQRLPAQVEGSESAFDILNVTARVRCLDEERSGVTFWTAHDHRPELAGQYRMVSQVRIRAEDAGPHGIFRIEGWEIALVVSTEIKELLAAASGILFEEVS
ncbi:MAG TPA: DUF1629 domain-containing protein [Longimicrobium sp.]|nr:DUF1629 domain-containing protein [Longimicrobium sp.]